MDVRVALISGRSVAAAREMTGVHGLSYAGVHGLEIAVGGTIEPTPGLEDAVAGARAVLRDVAGLKVDGLIVEDKGPTVAFHYRNALNEWAARAAILDAIGRSQAAEAFNVHEGRKVVELRPPTEANKGTATTELAARLGVKAIVCIGDDITDLDMFSACIGLRDQGTEVAVVAARSQEVAREVMDAAEYCVDGVSGVEWLLGEIVSALR
jgi:trehalose 6-phosphate phosphatase